MKKIILLLVLSTLITSCRQNQNNRDSYAIADMEDQMNPTAKEASTITPPPLEKQEVIKKKIIKDGRLGLRVTELEKTKVRVDTLVKLYEGYYANENFNNTDWESTYSLKIRIPSENFEKFIAEIESGDGEIQYKEIDARDVTDQFIDLETRLENKKNYLKRYNDLLIQAKTVKEILEIEEKIRVLEEEIESTTGRLKYLGDLVDYSTLDLTITKLKDFKYNPENRDKFSERLKQSLSKGWFGFVDFLLLMIRIWPFWVILTSIIVFWRKYRSMKKKKLPGNTP